MPAEKLTESRISRFVKAGLPEGKSSLALWATAPKGLGIRLRKGGAASWIYVYRPRGAGQSTPSRTVTLGSWGALTLRQAETAATALAGEIALKGDLHASTTLGRALDGFEAERVARKIVNAATIMSTLRRGLKSLLTREIDTLTRKDLVILIDRIEADGRPGAAQDLRKHSRSMLEWAVSQGLARHNVMAGLRRPRSSRAERLEGASKARALDDDGIGRLWTASTRLGPFGGLIQLALLTGLRRSELSGLQWSDVHDDRIVIAANRAKTGARHEVPLTAAMQAVLSAQPRTTSDLVFPGRGNAQMAGWSKLVPRAQRESGIDFRLHDLRRTCRTLMSRLGVDREAAELAVGHVKKELIALYDFDDAWGRRVDAFQRVSVHIAALQPSAPADAESVG